ncbi:MAG: hypothetical protein ACJ788_26240 [Ktedonobacteraceae bacterium]
MHIPLPFPSVSSTRQESVVVWRWGGTVSPTRGHIAEPNGEALLVRAERFLTEVERAQMEMQEYAGLARGRVVIGALQSLGAFRFPALLSRFHTRYPGIEGAFSRTNS